MSRAAILASPFFAFLMPAAAFAVDCAPFRPDAPVEQSAEIEIRAEVGGLLSRLIQVEGDYRVSDAQKALGANADDPDSLVRWQSNLFYFCEALNEDKSISTLDRIEIMRGIMDANNDAQLNEAIGDEIKESQTVDATGAALQTCVVDNRTLSCDFVVETSETAKEILVYAEHYKDASRLIDNQGNSYLAKSVDIGGQEDGRFVRTSLPPDIPMRDRLVFDNISNRATSAAILEVRGSLDGQDIPAFEFRDIVFE